MQALLTIELWPIAYVIGEPQYDIVAAGILLAHIDNNLALWRLWHRRWPWLVAMQTKADWFVGAAVPLVALAPVARLIASGFAILDSAHDRRENKGLLGLTLRFGRAL